MVSMVDLAVENLKVEDENEEEEEEDDDDDEEEGGDDGLLNLMHGNDDDATDILKGFAFCTVSSGLFLWYGRRERKKIWVVSVYLCYRK